MNKNKDVDYQTIFNPEELTLLQQLDAQSKEEALLEIQSLKNNVDDEGEEREELLELLNATEIKLLNHHIVMQKLKIAENPLQE